MYRKHFKNNNPKKKKNLLNHTTREQNRGSYTVCFKIVLQHHPKKHQSFFMNSETGHHGDGLNAPAQLLGRSARTVSFFLPWGSVIIKSLAPSDCPI